MLRQTHNPYEIRDLFEEDFAHRPEYIYKYRFCYAYHLVRAPFVLYNYYVTTEHVSKVFIAEAQDPKVIRHMSFEPTKMLRKLTYTYPLSTS